MMPRLLVAAVLAAAATPAFGAENLDCVDSGYDAAQQAALDDYAGRFDMDSWGTKGPPADVMALVVERTRVCAAQHGWSPEAAQHALLFKLARVGLAGAEQNGALTAGQIAQLRNALTPDDKARARAVFAMMVKAHNEGQKPSAETPDMFIGRLILRSGVPGTPDVAKAAGGWIAATVLCEQYAEFFAAD